MRISRRQFLGIGGGGLLPGAGAWGYVTRFEPRRLVTTFKEIKGLGLKERVRVLHLSDFHASDCVPWSQIQESIEIGLSHSPDLVFLTGDFITGPGFDFSDYPKYLQALKGHPACFASLGNHDLPYRDPGRSPSLAAKLEEILEGVGAKLLFNEAVEMKVRGSDLRISGLGDLWSREVWPDRCLKPAASKDMTTLLLAHNPDTKTDVLDYQWDVMFSGHTHGGQLVVPILGWRPFLPVRDTSMVEGIYPWNGRHIHITRGVGCLHGMRINCPPEISLIDLV